MTWHDTTQHNTCYEFDLPWGSDSDSCGTTRCHAKLRSAPLYLCSSSGLAFAERVDRDNDRAAPLSLLSKRCLDAANLPLAACFSGPPFDATTDFPHLTYPNVQS